MTLASPDEKAREGHYGFADDSEEGQDYITDLDWCLDYALENRYEIVRRTVEVIAMFCTGGAYYEELINRNHNHAELKDGLWIHRKGATHAEEGMLGVIPGNMRDGACIVKGKGNPDALYSSSHGAGREMGRAQAKRQLSMEDFEREMNGIKALVSKDILDEAPMAYKNFDEIMALQKELVEVITLVKPIINVKDCK
jgi:tRNA-splicing ligase RtcB